jgi:hypothetical protein
MQRDPLKQTREDYAELIEHISLPDSPVGIDAKLTHAIIIDYLQQISARLEKLEQRLDERA